MSYEDGNYNGKIYIGHVKWNNDYKHVMDFGSAATRDSFLKSHLTEQSGKIGLVPSPNGYIDLNGVISGIENKNYLYYCNSSDIGDTYYCCFITNYEILAKRTTRVYVELDIFQQYFYSTAYYQSYIERAIISKAADNNNTNYLPEPVSAPLEYENKIKDILTSDDWNPVWVLHMASYYNTTTKEYQYKGIGTNNTYGEYGRFIESQSEIEQVLKMYGRKSVQEIALDVGQSSGNTTWQDWVNAIFSGQALSEAIESVKATTSIADLQDHRNELIGLYAIPKWLKDNFDGDTNFADNRRSYVDISLPINSNTLANGYTPRNKKLLTSVCRGYILANKTGMQKAFKPELFTGSPTLRIAGITMSTSGYQWHISNYSDIINSYDEVAYNSERRVGFDANTGLNKTINTISAGAALANSVSGMAGAVATRNPVNVISSLSDGANNLVKAFDQIGQQEQHFGHNGDLLRITGGRAQLSWYEISPTRSECESIDNFFDMYGYTINKHARPSSYFNTRSLWNYIKTNDCNLTALCPTDFENKLKDIFNNGVTLWHYSFNNNTGYSHFGDYSQNNT